MLVNPEAPYSRTLLFTLRNFDLLTFCHMSIDSLASDGRFAATNNSCRIPSMFTVQFTHIRDVVMCCIRVHKGLCFLSKIYVRWNHMVANVDSLAISTQSFNFFSVVIFFLHISINGYKAKWVQRMNVRCLLFSFIQESETSK